MRFMALKNLQIRHFSNQECNKGSPIACEILAHVHIRILLVTGQDYHSFNSIKLHFIALNAEIKCITIGVITTIQTQIGTIHWNSQRNLLLNTSCDVLADGINTILFTDILVITWLMKIIFN